MAARRGRPRSPHDLGRHMLVFYIEPLMRFTDLHIIQRHFPDSTIGFASTNVVFGVGSFTYHSAGPRW